jgi:IS30 family transposase
VAKTGVRPNRLIPGHWNADLIKVAFNRSAVGTLIERKRLPMTERPKAMKKEKNTILS